MRVNNVPRGWTLVSATTGGHDALDEPIDIRANVADLTLTFENRPLGSISGTVTRQTTGSTTVVVFPADAAKRTDTIGNARRVRAIRLVNDTFAVGNLPPGSYLVIALDGDAPTGWQDPARLAAWAAHATTVDVTVGEAARVTLQVDK